jgi:hypothetical protein
MPVGQIELRRQARPFGGAAAAREAGSSAESMPCTCVTRSSGGWGKGAAATVVRPASAVYQGAAAVGAERLGRRATG